MRTMAVLTLPVLPARLVHMRVDVNEARGNHIISMVDDK